MADYWIKLYHEILDDPKMAVLPDRLWRRVIELFLMAGRLHKDGLLPDTNQIAWMLRMPTDDLILDLQQIALTGIIERQVNGWKVVKFAKRQAAVPAKERMEQMRDRQHRQQYYGSDTQDVTQPLRNVTQITDIQITDNRSDTDGAVGKLSAVFTQSTKILPYKLDKWSEACQMMFQGGVTSDTLQKTITKMMNPEKGEKALSITGPWSVVNMAIANQANGHEPKTEKQPAGHWAVINGQQMFIPEGVDEPRTD